MFEGSYLIPVGFNFIQWMADHVVAPIVNLLVEILRPIFGAFLKLIGSLIMTLLSGFLFNIYVIVLGWIDVVQSMFSRFSGAEEIHSGSSAGGKVASSFMTNAFINLGTVNRAFLGILLIALILCFAFTILAVIRSAGDMTGQFTVNEVLKRAMRAFLTFAALQFIVIGTVFLSNRVLEGIDKAMGISIAADSGVSDMKISHMIFVCSAAEAAKKSGETEKSNLISRYLKPETELSDAADDFNVTKIDYIFGGIATLLMLYILFSSIFFFIQRTIEVVFLYLISPFFVAAIPLDGGKRYSDWREMFVAKCIASYGMVVMMRLFFIFAPMIMGAKNSVIFIGIPDSYVYYIKLIFIIGAGFAVKKGHSALLHIVNPQAAQQADNAMGGAMAIATSLRSAGRGMGAAIRGKK